MLAAGRRLGAPWTLRLAGWRPRCARARRLDGLLDLAALEAACADVRARRLAAEEHADALEIRVEATLGRHQRVAPVVAERRLLPADCTDLGHGGECS